MYSTKSHCFIVLKYHNSFVQKLVDESADENNFTGKTSQYPYLACDMQRDPAHQLWFSYHLRFTQRPYLNHLGNVDNMLIQIRIACVDVSEKIDLGRQLRHFFEIFENNAVI